MSRNSKALLSCGYHSFNPALSTYPNASNESYVQTLSTPRPQRKPLLQPKPVPNDPDAARLPLGAGMKDHAAVGACFQGEAELSVLILLVDELEPSTTSSPFGCPALRLLLTVSSTFIAAPSRGATFAASDATAGLLRLTSFERSFAPFITSCSFALRSSGDASIREPRIPASEFDPSAEAAASISFLTDTGGLRSSSSYRISVRLLTRQTSISHLPVASYRQ